MSWLRGPYTFETCLHWLLGSKPGAEMHAQWRELFDIGRLHFTDHEIVLRIENADGAGLNIYRDVDRLEAELLRRAPQDERAIRELTRSIRLLGGFRMPDPTLGTLRNALRMAGDIRLLPQLNRLMGITGAEYAERFTDPLLRSFFDAGEMGRLSAIALVFSLAWMNTGNAGYCHGGSQAIVRLIEERIAELGGRIRFGARVERILVEKGRAVGVELASGERAMGDWVISAADGYATLFKMLEGRYLNGKLRAAYETMEVFPSYVQVSFGVRRDLSAEPPMLTLLLDKALDVDPETSLDQLSARIFHFDPTFAPPGATAVTCFLPTRNVAYWERLRTEDKSAYRGEKQRVAEAVLAILDRRMPGLRGAVEVTDVSTPASVVRYTGNWKGSMEGWLIAPGTGIRMLPQTLPGLEGFAMVGQWVAPGGGLPSGPMTARPVLKAICRRDGVRFAVRAVS
jgi:phytoene dehydrogenase-like protein